MGCCKCLEIKDHLVIFRTLIRFNQDMISKTVHSIFSLGLYKEILPKVWPYTTKLYSKHSRVWLRGVWAAPAALPSVTVKALFMGHWSIFLEKAAEIIRNCSCSQTRVPHWNSTLHSASELIGSEASEVGEVAGWPIHTQKHTFLSINNCLWHLKFGSPFLKVHVVNVECFFLLVVIFLLLFFFIVNLQCRLSFKLVFKCNV